MLPVFISIKTSIYVAIRSERNMASSITKISCLQSQFTSDSLCIFCLKNIVTSDSLKEFRKEISDRFLKLLERFLGLGGTLGYSGRRLLRDNHCLLSCCDDCHATISSFCAQFHELECMQLRLQWRLERLVNIMKLANRVPSRVKQLNRLFVNQSERAKDSEDVGDGGIEMGLEDFRKFRNNIIKKCKWKLAKSKGQPCVLLTRTCGRGTDSSSHVSHVNQSLLDSNGGDVKPLATFLGWILSYSVVALLAPSSANVTANEYMTSSLSLDGCEEDRFSDGVEGGDVDIAKEYLSDEDDTLEADSDEASHASERTHEHEDNVIKTEAPENHAGVPDVYDPNTKVEIDNDISSDPVPDGENFSETNFNDGSLKADSEPGSCAPVDSDDINRISDLGVKTVENISKILASKEKRGRPSGKGKRHPCSHCRNYFSNYYSLRVHKTRHCKENPRMKKATQLCPMNSETSEVELNENQKPLPDEPQTALKIPRTIGTEESNPSNCSNKNYADINSQTESGAENIKVTTIPRYGLRAKRTISYLKMEQDDQSDDVNNFEPNSDAESFSSSSDNESNGSGEFEKSLKNSTSESVSKRKGKKLKTIIGESVTGSSISGTNKLTGQNCSICNAQLGVNTYYHFLTQHKTDGVDPSKIQRCEQCPAYFLTNKQLVVHKAGIHFTNKCPQCQKSFTKPCLLIYHLDKTHPEFEAFPSRPHICDLGTCRRKFSTAKELAKHKEKAKNGRIHQGICTCNECGKRFRDNSLLFLHRLRHHSKGKCLECAKSFSKTVNLRRHMRTAHPACFPDLPVFPCEVEGCKLTFEFKSRRDSHMKVTHNDQQLLECSECGRKLKGKLGLSMHMKNVHTDRSNICSECGKAFKNIVGLHNHMKYHEGPDTWKFQCATCGRKFPFRGKLEQHMGTHSKEKPYICQFCGERYAHRHNWRNHVKTKHKEKFSDI